MYQVITDGAERSIGGGETVGAIIDSIFRLTGRRFESSQNFVAITERSPVPPPAPGARRHRKRLPTTGATVAAAGKKRHEPGIRYRRVSIDQDTITELQVAFRAMRQQAAASVLRAGPSKSGGAKEAARPPTVSLRSLPLVGASAQGFESTFSESGTVIAELPNSLVVLVKRQVAGDGGKQATRFNVREVRKAQPNLKVGEEGDTVSGWILTSTIDGTTASERAAAFVASNAKK